MNVTGISETKWFGQAVYEVEGYTILHSGHPIPEESQTAEQNDGVGIALDPQMKTAWKEAGEIWKAVSSWIVTARIKITRQAGAMPDRQSSRGALLMNVISVYAPINPPSQRSSSQLSKKQLTGCV